MLSYLRKKRRGGRSWGHSCLVSTLFFTTTFAVDASAQTAPAPRAAAPATGQTGSVVINLIQQLVQEGVLTQERAAALIHQAQDEAVSAARAQEAPVSSSAALPPTSVRIPYVPQVVRNQIRDEVKADVLREASEKNWGNAVPEWTRRFHLNGDFRLRYEWDLFDGRNNLCPGSAPCSSLANYAALNGGLPFDLDNAAQLRPATLDTTQNRERMRIRARLGINVDVADGLTAGFRLATGNTTNPVTTMQTLGTTLNKQNFLLDRAFLDYHPADWIELWVGQFANPFLSTDMVWDEDINFAGAAGRLRGRFSDDFSLFATGGAFPIENTAFNSPDNQAVKTSRDKWLYAAQVGMDWQVVHSFNFKLAGAYYHFTNLEGVLSSPCIANTNADTCDTDNSRPMFQQFGNTMFAIRNLVTDVTNINNPNPPNFQYYGLATPFHELDLNTRMDYGTGPIHIVVDGDVVKNVAFSRQRILGHTPLNNLGPDVNGVAGSGVWDGGSLGYQARLLVGYPEIHERFEWSASFAYKHIDSDAVPDAFNDSDFHLGGTNAKGYVVSAAMGVAHNVDLNARWLSASEVTSFPYTVDVVLVDLNARF